MAKSGKTNLDYFRWVIRNGITSDKGILYRTNCQKQNVNESWGVLMRALERIFSGEGGYYSDWNDNSAFFIARDVMIKEEEAKNAIKEAVNVGYFDKEMFDNYSILTSKEVQEIYFGGIRYANRTYSEINEDYLLIDLKRVHGEFTKNSEEFTVKENKEKESKEKENKEEEIKEKKIKINQYKIGSIGGGNPVAARANVINDTDISDRAKSAYGELMGRENRDDKFLAHIIEQFGEPCTLWAIDRAFMNGKPNNAYIKAILKAMTEEEKEAAEDEFSL